MFRKILFLLLLSSTGIFAQRIGPDYDCFDFQINNIESNQKFIKEGDLYKVCKNQTVTPVPAIETQFLYKTDKYTLEQIPYNVYPLTGGTEVVFGTGDGDDWGPVDLPFKFCFFGEVYDKVAIWGNGIVSFTIPNDPGLRQSFVNDCTTSLANDGINAVRCSFYYASIFGTWQHTHLDGSDEFAHASINYRVEGTAPCRRFIVSYSEVPPYGLGGLSDCPPPVQWQSHQIVLYETTNVVEVNIVDHTACPANRPDDASSIVGIIDHTGQVRYVPPGRDFGPWDAFRESYRFAPAGDEVAWEIEWTVDGEFSPDGTTIVDRQKEIVGKLIVNSCDAVYSESFKITVEPALDINKIDLEYVVCDKNQNVYDLNEITRAIKDAQGNGGERLKFLYYPSFDDAMNKSNEVKDIKNYPITGDVNKITKTPVFARIEIAGLDDCFEIIPATIIKAAVEVIFKPDINLCEEFKLPKLTNDEVYYKMERLDEDAKFIVETISNPYEDQLIDRAGFYRVYVKKTNEYKCEDIKSYLLFVESCTYPKGISPNGDGNNDYLDLTYNNVVELKIYNRYGKLVYKHGKGYKRQWSGQDSSGKQLPTGTYFLNVKTKDSEYQDWIQLMYEVK